MLGFLAGVPGKLNTLLTRLSETWASKLDTLSANFTATIAGRIDAAISSRAAASDYTSSRAGYLDKLNAGGTIGTVKSIQTFNATVTINGSRWGNNASQAISAVTTSKSIVIVNGASGPADDAAEQPVMCRAVLASSTSVTVFVSTWSAPATAKNYTVSFTVVEYH